jgi:hypothetical protein
LSIQYVKFLWNNIIQSNVIISLIINQFRATSSPGLFYSLSQNTVPFLSLCPFFALKITNNGYCNSSHKTSPEKGVSLFPDIYNDGQRYKEYLKLFVSKDYTKPENKNMLKNDKYSWELKKAIQAKRFLHLKEHAAGFTPKPSKQDFIEYYRIQAVAKAHATYDCALIHRWNSWLRINCHSSILMTNC